MLVSAESLAAFEKLLIERSFVHGDAVVLILFFFSFFAFYVGDFNMSTGVSEPKFIVLLPLLVT